MNANFMIDYKYYYIASITTIIRVNQTMLIENGSSQEAFTANITFKWTFAGMHLAYVVLQIWTDRVACLASLMRTRKRFDS